MITTTTNNQKLILTVFGNDIFSLKGVESLELASSKEGVDFKTGRNALILKYDMVAGSPEKEESKDVDVTEYVEQIESLKKENASLKRQITKLKKDQDTPSEPDTNES